MKKLLLTIAISLPFLASAQILNPGFETTRNGGGPANWGRVILIALPCEVSEGYDSTYFQSTDAHTGTYALEMRNAHCDTSFYFGGGANLMFDDSFYFGSGVPFTDRPSAITLYYKLLPLGGDVGHITVMLIDEINGDGTIATADVIVDQPASEYTLLTIPLTYENAGTPSSIVISMGMMNLDSHVNYGSRFLVDDVSTLTTGLTNTAVTGVSVFPNPTQGNLTIKTKETQPLQLMVYNALGQEVMNDKVMPNTTIDVQHLSPGAYYYRVLSNTKPMASGKLLRE